MLGTLSFLPSTFLLSFLPPSLPSFHFPSFLPPFLDSSLPFYCSTQHIRAQCCLAVGLPWPQDTRDPRDVLRACLERQWPSESRAKTQMGDLLEGDQGRQPCDWQLGSEKQPKKSLASFAHKASILSHHTGTDTHRPEPQRTRQ